MDEHGKCLLNKVCRRPEGTFDKPGKWNPISYHQSLSGELSERVIEEVRALVSSKQGILMFPRKLDVDLLGVGPESCQIIDIQEPFNARGYQELGMATKTLPPFPESGNYLFKNLSEALLGKSIREVAHDALEDTKATMELFQWGRRWILPEVVSKFQIIKYFYS